LFKTPEESSAATAHGLAALFERQLGHDLMWTQRDLRALRELGPLTTTLAPVEALQEQAFESIRRWVTERRVEPLTAETFAKVLEKAKSDLRGIVPRSVDLLREILMLRQELLVVANPPPGLANDLAKLMPADFLRQTPFAQLAHFPRYLRAMKLRAERARKNLAKDAERVAQIEPYERALARLASGAAHAHAKAGGTPAVPGEVERLRWLIEEFRVSLFAQELGTAEPVSTVKLDRALAASQTGNLGRQETAPPVAPKPIVSAPLTEKKSAPIKNLNALDKLFGR
jgi:ATP-dependent helicase HrpA